MRERIYFKHVDNSGQRRTSLPRGLAVDSRGDIYVGEVSYTEYPRLFPESRIPWRMRSLRKPAKVN